MTSPIEKRGQGLTDPSALLLAAADRVRDLAAAATPGQWEVDEGSGRVELVLRSPSADVVVVHRFSPHPDSLNRADARWIAALSPALAEPLEAMLRRAASDLVVFVAAWESTPRADGAVERLVEQQFGGALGVAKTILGSGVDTRGA